MDIRKLNLKAVLICGGPHATLFPERVLAETAVDYVFRGEAERSLAEFVERHAREQSVQDIAGLSYRDGRRVAHNEDVRFVEDLDTLPTIDRHFVELDMYSRVNDYLGVTPVDHISTSRGCPFKCSFCSSEIIWKQGYRFRSADSVVSEIEHMMARHGSRGFYFREDNFTLNRRRVMELCHQILEHDLAIEWACETRVDIVDDELLGCMSQAGCRGIWFGVESGSQRMLTKYKGGRVTVSDVRNAFALCRKHGIKTGASFMIGFPDETLLEMWRSFVLANRIGATSAWFNPLVGIPGSRLYSELLAAGQFSEQWNNLLTVKHNRYSIRTVYGIAKLFNLWLSLRRLRVVWRREQSLAVFLRRTVRRLLSTR